LRYEKITSCVNDLLAVVAILNYILESNFNVFEAVEFRRVSVIARMNERKEMILRIIKRILSENFFWGRCHFVLRFVDQLCNVAWKSKKNRGMIFTISAYQKNREGRVSEKGI